MEMKKLILIIFLSCISVPCFAANQEILKGDILYNVWNGEYRLSSNHTGDIHISLEDVKSINFTLIDEEHSTEYSGSIISVARRKEEITIHCQIDELKSSGFPKTKSNWEKMRGTFEINIQGTFISLAQYKANVIIGKISFSGSSEDAQWFSKMNGTVVLHGFE